MISNGKVAARFVGGKTESNYNMHATRNSVFSYSTIICERDTNGIYYFNASRYSNTTAKHQNEVLHELLSLNLIEGETLIYCYPDRWGISSLKQFAFGNHKK